MKTTGFFSLMFLIILMFLCLPHTFAQEPTVLEHGGAVSSVAFSPVNPALLASAGGHNTVKVWDLRDNTVKTLKGHTEVVNSVTFSPDGKWLVSSSGDATIKMWDISRWQNIETREPITFRIPFSVQQVAFSPDGKMLATAGRHVNLLDIINQTEIATLPHDSWVWVMDFSHDGKYLAADDGVGTTMKVWDVEKRQITATLDGHAGDVNFVKFSPDARTLATASWGGDIKLWGVSNWELLGTLQTDVAAVDFSPDGKILASAGWETVRLWSAENGEHITTLTGHTGGEWVRGVAFSPDGRTLATGGGDGTVHIWDIEPYLQSQQQAGIVRLIYFLPKDRAPQPDIDAKMDALIKEVQQAYAGQMNYYGFGRKTFRFETDVHGKAVVHHIVGRFTDEHYRNLPYTWDIWEEIDERFDASKNIYLTVIDISSEVLDGGGVCGRGGPHGTFGGLVLIPIGGCFNLDVTVHELGHAFGLLHDFRNDLKPWIDLYTTEPMTNSPCAAEWLDAHQYFNTHQTSFNELTMIEMVSPGTTRPDGMHLHFKITDPDGLHQVQLFTTVEYLNAPDLGILDCKSLEGSSNIVDFVVPTSALEYSSEITLRVIDQQGDFSSERFYANPQAGPKIEGPWVWVIAPTGTNGSAAATSGIDYLAEASDGVVTEKQVAANGATAGEAVGNSVWTLGRIAPIGGNNITELVNAIGLGEGDVDNHVAYGSIVLDSPRIQETRMHVGSDDAVKVWLNGVLVHDNPVDRGAKDYQENFPVTLKQGTNILLVAVYEGAVYWSGFFGFDADAEYTVLIPDALDLPTQIAEDVNSDGVVNIQDLVLVAASLGQAGENVADVNGDGMVNIQDLVLVAGALGNAAAAPSFHPQVLSTLTAADIQKWLTQAQHLDRADTRVQSGIRFLEQLLAALIPKETTLLANYPNPFNPETWIPYQLAKPADVTLRIYSVNGSLVQTLALGHQPAGIYQSRARAAYWNGRNALGEPVASGVYFYTLTAGEFTATRKMSIRK